MNKAILKNSKTLFLMKLYKYTIKKRYCNTKQIKTILSYIFNITL